MRKGTITSFIARNVVAWELAMAVLTVLYLVIAIEDDANPAGVPPRLVAGLAALFFLEFAVRCWDAPSRWTYARRHWADIAACIPLVGVLRGLRLLRLVRVAAGIKFLGTVDEVGLADSRQRDVIRVVIVVVLVLWSGAAYAMWNLEQGANPSIHSYGDALYWAAITATGVGYGDITPVTAGGRLIAGLLAFLGLGVVGFVSSQLTVSWLKPADHQTASRETQLERELIQLRSEMSALRTLLERHHDAREPVLNMARREEG